MIAIFIVILCFIWGNSMLPPGVSLIFSNSVGNFFAEVLGSGDGANLGGVFSLRKMAHFAEFGILGAVSSLLVRIFISDKKLKFSIILVLGLFVPVVDETIQIFSGRAPLISDVWIDALGYAVGCAMMFLIYFVRRKIAEKSEKQP